MWTYKTHTIYSLKHVPKDAYGFVYQITILGEGYQSLYIGKKALYHTIKRKMGKKALVQWREQNKIGRPPKYAITKKESDWLRYAGSHPTLLEHKGPIIKDIFCFAFSKKELTYLEEKYQFMNNVLENPLFINDNIGGRYFRSELKLKLKK